MGNSTIETYQTKSFAHEGVSGSKPVDRLSETNTNIAITPEVMTMNNGSLTKIVKDNVSSKGQGEGMPGDSGKVKK